ncbi:MAG: amino acid adenylation domain-containing protein [Candidatus Marinimicrobia bacterium]|jgi:amino acid adenylation domain-containing protein|nr:amino acid adenylation domain-containing protein [Candidatus Neomarinimicrobiota bacterium]MBT3576073.1 amino acid adenylation domain-containing protein [Candidatus Neomarinimicrobiota bacterium]MBT3679814.1 amino acid adenylation domain-containing protein [Candidatus Neomarinimicrobiota bacterium]MBT4480987.1 amino acid adenylation domain-containing protein [Candidatus Neomarinimicrobiota bacterium]MBT5235755.1 amino acid adenylation domain-containing protein [Candidatus Neomarinimicrobiota
MISSEKRPENVSEYPATSAQKRLFFLSLLEGGEAPYHLPGAIKLHGSIQGSKLEDALRQLIQRHDCLRTGFKVGNDGVNQVVYEAVDFELKHISCSESDVDQMLKDSIEVFDPSIPPLFHASLLQTEKSDLKYLLLDIHHIAADGISWTILLNDLEDILNSKSPQPLPLSFVESSALINKNSQLNNNDIHKNFWLEYFHEIPPSLDLPADHPRAGIHDFEGDAIQWSIEGDQLQALRQTARTLGISIHVFLLSIYAALLKSITGQDNFVVSFPHSGRFEPEFERVAGMFAGTGLIKVNPDDGQSFKHLAKTVQRETLDIFDHLEYPYEEILENLDISHDLSRNPLTDVSFVYETSTDRHLNLVGLETTFFPINKHTSFFDLTLDVSDNDKALVHTFEYKSALFEKRTVETWRDSYLRIVDQIIDDPDLLIGKLAIMGEGEKEHLIRGRNQTEAKLMFEMVPGEIGRTISQYKSATAISYDDQKMSYAELGDMSSRVSAHLQNQFPDLTNHIVAVMLERSIHLPSILLGIWDSGACYLPIDPTTPRDRVMEILRLSGCRLLISDHHIDLQGFDIQQFQVHDLIKAHSGDSQVSAASLTPESLAYVIYTSGTTGTPKGVKITHGNLANYLSWAKTEYLGAGCSGEFPLFTSLAFDLTVTSIFLPLLSGKTLHIQEDSYLVNESLKAIFSIDSGVDAVKMTPSHVLLLNDPSIQKETGVHLVILGGEAVQTNHLEILSRFTPVPRIVNEYGPTETTVGVVAKYLLHNEHDIYIGKPISNTTVYVLNEVFEPVLERAVGELYVGGKSVSPGYLNDPEITKERFISNPFIDGDILYRTGDLVRWTVAGQLEYLGRNDQQVKIRGHRVDPLEIQKALIDLNHIENAAVVDKLDQENRVILVAYIVSDGIVDHKHIHAQLSLKLPTHMIPHHMVQIASIPLTANGKVDHKSLPEPDSNSRQIQDMVMAPRNPLEQAIISVWEAVLNRSPIGVTDNYFRVGGDSIHSIQIVSRMAEQGYQISIRDIFEAPTPDRLAQRIKKVKKIQKIDQTPMSGVVGLAPIQKRFFRQHSFYRGHYTQAILVGITESVNVEILKETLSLLHKQHDMLRARYSMPGGHVEQVVTDDYFFVHLDSLSAHDSHNQIDLETSVENLAATMDLASGPLLKAAVLMHDGEDALLMVGHHLILDAVSWSILMRDMNTLYEQLESGTQAQLPLRTHSYREFVDSGQKWLETNDLTGRATYWQNIVDGSGPVIGNDLQRIGAGSYDEICLQNFEFGKEFTDKIAALASSREVSVQDVLVAALEVHLEACSSASSWSIDLEHFGRSSLSEPFDYSRTVGWFTSIYPYRLERRSSSTPQARLRAISRSSKDHALISHEFLLLQENKNLSAEFQSSDLLFNYLGNVTAKSKEGRFYLKELLVKGSIGGSYPRSHPFELEGWLHKEQLKLHLAYPESFSTPTIESWWQGYLNAIEKIVVDGQQEIDDELMDLQLVQDHISEHYTEHAIEAFYRLTPVQEGMLFHRLREPDSPVYHEVFRMDISGELNVDSVQKTWDKVRQRHPILRTSFHADKIPYPIQVVHTFEEIPLEYVDLSDLPALEQAKAIESRLEKECASLFDLKTATLQHYILLKQREDLWTMIWSYPHILLDGWSTAIVLEDWFRIYTESFEDLDSPNFVSNGIEQSNGFEDYVNWYAAQSATDAGSFWRHYLGDHVISFISDSNSDDSEEMRSKKLVQSLSDSQSEILKEIAIHHEVTLSQVVHLLWALVLGNQVGRSDVVFGSVNSVRPSGIPDIENTAGLFLTTLPVRFHWSNDETFQDILMQTRDHFLAREEHLRISLTEMGAENIFDHILTVENYPFDSGRFKAIDDSGETIRLLDVETIEASHFPLTIEVYLNEAIEWHFIYSTTKINGSTLENMIINMGKIIDTLDESTANSISILMEKIRSEKEIAEEKSFLNSIAAVDEDF